MNASVSTMGNLLINGRFLGTLWTRMMGMPEKAGIVCPIWAKTFAADRWRLRYAAAVGGEVSQARSTKVPEAASADESLEIRGGADLRESVLVGQDIEAQESPNYRRRLRFAAWVLVEHPSISDCEVSLVIGSPSLADQFDNSTETALRHVFPRVRTNRWEKLESEMDLAELRKTGLRVELELPSSLLSHSLARVTVTDISLTPPARADSAHRPAALEAILAARYFQRYDSARINGVGRVLGSNPHELHFQFSFPEMRISPSCGLPHDNADLCVFSADGVPQNGFTYDVSYGARESVIIRATKMRHQLRDGYLAFRGRQGAITLEAEL